MTQPTINQKLALEMAMQDVMGNMEELALDFGFYAGEACFEILAIEPTDVPDAPLASDKTPACRSPFGADIHNLKLPCQVA